MIEVITLDLEGTLISSAVSQFPRPGCRKFLEYCISTQKKLMWFTAVSTLKVQGIVELLVEEGYFPEECLLIPCVEWLNLPVHYKDLTLTGYAPSQVLAVDDWAPVYLPEHQSQLISIAEFEHPYSWLDAELLNTQQQLATRLYEETKLALL